MTDSQVLASCTSMIFAGSETTAISLSAVFHNLLENPRVYKKLMEELDEATRNGTIADKENNKVSWVETQKLPCKYTDMYMPLSSLKRRYCTSSWRLDSDATSRPEQHARTSVTGADSSIFTRRSRRVHSRISQSPSRGRTHIGKDCPATRR